MLPFFENVIASRAQKFVVAVLASAVTWVSTHVVPIDHLIDDGWIHAAGAAITVVLVYLVRNARG